MFGFAMEGSGRTFTPITATILLVASTLMTSLSNLTFAEEAEWIWDHGSNIATPVPTGQACYFRKSINLKIRSTGRVEIAADDEFQLFVNGKKIGSGKSSRELQQFDISEQLEVGRNVVAVKVLNTHGSTAALAARVSVKPEKQPKWFTFSSDASWKVSNQESPMWESVVFNDRLWGTAASFGELGDTVPWDRAEDVVAEIQTEQQERFQIQKGFGVQRVLSDEN